ncbi:alpha/beta hydrolase [Conexibacter sp. JD483]|uniref:alpha/beta hydrolase n=1 Tax=unclassified Conexibacter TaxID=2627773 RepID=UPI0027185364|nr:MULTISPECIES: alpha/beta hydrolase [unclassified Conexibacter]MDO8185722.1 alpha/beta hydrolase [Conexibacter sp. CPCC 205706]MDO8199099.1 alpha/beta hydrolase [Conexibacter sp. CPCC 205762]MDR9370953.1 alpha/beta hydrolase [Conexibacter sp. JD483]
MPDPVRLGEVYHGPAAQQTRALERTLRRTWIPLARSWRLTPRGIRLLKRVTDPTERVPVLKGTRVEQTRTGDRPAEWVLAPRAREQAALRDGDRAADSVIPATDAPIVLYLHGGGYVFGSPRTHRSLVSRISHVTGMAALSLDYRLPPEATLPAPTEDALAAYRELLDAGRDPSRIVVAGDSAGGNLALSLALHAAEAGLPRPAALVLLSPWADLSLSHDSFTGNALLDPFIPPAALRRFARIATTPAFARDPADWRASPIFAPDELWRQAIPPAIVQVGSTELLLDESRAVAERVAAAGQRAELHVFDRQPHVPPLWGGTPAARTALHLIGRFTTSVLAPQSAPEPPTIADAGTAAELPPTADAPRS